MSDENRERGLVCLFCGEGFGYAGQTPDEATLKAACDHEAMCPRNPYKAEVERMREYIRDHVHAFIDSAEIDRLMSYEEWCQLDTPNESMKRGE